MTLRKIAGLLAAFGLTVGLIGGGVGAVFQDQVTATENISVGAVACEITGASPGGPEMFIAPDKKSVTYTPPTITSSAPNAIGLKFDFTVKNTGTIPAVFTVDSPGTQFSQFATYAPAPSGPNPVAPNDSIIYTGAGVTWGDLTIEEGKSYSFTWQVNCGEVPATQEVISSDFNFSGTGWAGWSCPAGTKIVSAALVGATNPYALGLAKLGEPAIDGFTYPVYPHYTFGANEEGAVVHNGGTAQTAHLVLQCTK